MSHTDAEAGAGTATDQAEDLEPQGEETEGQLADPDGETPEGEEEEDLASQLAHWKSQARKHEQRAKENNKAAAELKKIQDRDKSELQLAEERAAEAERERDEALRTHHQIMAAASYDIPTDLIDFLGNGTAEEIDERAELLSTTISAAATRMARQVVEGMGLEWPGDGRNGRHSSPTAEGAARAGSRPVESLVSGTSPAGGGPVTPEDFFRRMARGEL